jgi:hypothetical protein
MHRHHRRRGINNLHLHLMEISKNYAAHKADRIKRSRIYAEKMCKRLLQQAASRSDLSGVRVGLRFTTIKTSNNSP